MAMMNLRGGAARGKLDVIITMDLVREDGNSVA